MEDTLTSYKRDLDSLKTKKAQVDVKIQNCRDEAGKLKQELANMGYASLDEAKEDYARRAADLKDKHAQVKTLIAQINSVESEIPSKDEILEELKESIKVLAPVAEDNIRQDKLDLAADDLKEELGEQEETAEDNSMFPNDDLGL